MREVNTHKIIRIFLASSIDDTKEERDKLQNKILAVWNPIFNKFNINPNRLFNPTFFFDILDHFSFLLFLFFRCGVFILLQIFGENYGSGEKKELSIFHLLYPQ